MVLVHIRDVKKNLYAKLDARKTANHLYQRGALNKKELEEIQRLSSDRPTTAAEELLDIVLSQTVDFYDCFLDSLKKTDQLDVHQWIVLKGLSFSLSLFTKKCRQLKTLKTVKHETIQNKQTDTLLRIKSVVLHML